jgi:hypothetical protein
MSQNHREKCEIRTLTQTTLATDQVLDLKDSIREQTSGSNSHLTPENMIVF